MRERFRARESNPDYVVQSHASYQLDELEIRTSVGPQGVEPCRSRDGGFTGHPGHRTGQEPLRDLDPETKKPPEVSLGRLRVLGTCVLSAWRPPQAATELIARQHGGGEVLAGHNHADPSRTRRRATKPGLARIQLRFVGMECGGHDMVFFFEGPDLVRAR